LIEKTYSGTFSCSGQPDLTMKTECNSGWPELPGTNFLKDFLKFSPLLLVAEELT